MAVNPTPIPARAHEQLTPVQKQQRDIDDSTEFSRLWESVRLDFDTAISSEHIEEAHRLWCKVAETFLWSRETGGTELPAKDPRRGQVLPTEQKPVAMKICDVTRMARNGFSKRVQRVTGLIGDLTNRIKRLQGMGSTTYDKEQLDTTSKAAITFSSL